MVGGQKKCEQYWPEQGTQEYGSFKVTLTDQQVFADYTIRQLFVSVSLYYIVVSAIMSLCCSIVTLRIECDCYVHVCICGVMYITD